MNTLTQIIDKLAEVPEPWADLALEARRHVIVLRNLQQAMAARDPAKRTIQRAESAMNSCLATIAQLDS